MTCGMSMSTAKASALGLRLESVVLRAQATACARVMDAVTGAEMCRLDRGDLLNALAFSPDGTRSPPAATIALRGSGLSIMGC